MAKLVQISFSVIRDDPRIRRQNDGLKALGWNVAALGFSGGLSPEPDWPIYSPILNTAPSLLIPVQPLTFFKRLKRGIWFSITAFLGGITWIIAQVFRLFKPIYYKFFQQLSHTIWTDIGWPVRVLRTIRRKPIETLDDALAQLKKRQPIDLFIKKGLMIGPADIWVANDWTALPVAVTLQKQFGGVIAYDSHEFALEEYAQNLAWRMIERPIVEKIEGTLIQKVVVVTAVSPSIAEALHKYYSLDVVCQPIYNAPPYEPISSTPNDERMSKKIRVLYHGILAQGRGLEACIRSLKEWPSEFDLTLRGPENEKDYISSLTKLAEQCGVQNRLTIAPPVAMTQLVSSASAYDIGLFALPAYSAQNRFALPNKFFEYMAAGLAIIVSDLPEMAKIIKDTKCGCLIKEFTPIAISNVIKTMTPEVINEMKLASLIAAKTYNAKNEAIRLDALYRSVL